MLTRILYLLLDILFPSKFGDNDLKVMPAAKYIPDNRMHAVFSYQDSSVMRMVKHLKRISDRELCSICAKYMHEEINEDLGERSWVVIPIPTSKASARKHFNQASILAEELARADNRLSIKKDILYRIKSTKKQGLIKNRSDRLKNQSNSMSVRNNHEIENKNVLIIDDVITTGATCREAIRAIVSGEQKPANIICLALSH